MAQPLADRLRPKNLNEYLGQTHLIGKGAILRTSIESGKIHSMILWGPPGVGKTTLANIIASQNEMQFYSLSAINSGVNDIRNVIQRAKIAPNSAILFIDEIHRFSKSQQDSLLGAVEKGIITLIGATTENPSFEVIPALLSRCQVYVLKPLSINEMDILIDKAISELSIFYNRKIILNEAEALYRISGGDARKLLNAIELVVSSLLQSMKEINIDNESVTQIIQQKLVLYDKAGENHYDVISAFIKSIRGSDPNAAVYYLARMLEGGEDPKFIARRLVILASEDIGNANPNALLLAKTCFDAVSVIGMPESRIILSQTAIYFATSLKSNSSYLAIDNALEFVRKTGDKPVPLHLRNAPTKLMKDNGYGYGYLYAHGFDGNFVNQEFLPNDIVNTKFYEPQKNPSEEKVRDYLRSKWKEKYGY